MQAAISAVHGDAPDCARTNWGEICLHYAKLYDLQPSPIVALNAAVERSFAEGPTAGLTALDALAGAETLTAYQPFSWREPTCCVAPVTGQAPMRIIKLRMA